MTVNRVDMEKIIDVKAGAANPDLPRNESPAAQSNALLGAQDLSSQGMLETPVTPFETTEKHEILDSPMQESAPSPPLGSVDVSVQPESVPIDVSEDVAAPPHSENLQETVEPSKSAGGDGAPSGSDNLTDELLESPDNSQKESRFGTLRLVINDDIGHPIPSLGLKVLLKERIVFMGVSNGNGEIYIDGLPIEELLTIHVKTDGGIYKQVAVAAIGARENFASLKSPKTKIELTSIHHHGAPGSAAEEKTVAIQNHNQKPLDQPRITGNQPRRPVPKVERNEKGNPVARVSYGLTDWFNVNSLKSLRWPMARGMAETSAQTSSGSAGTPSAASTPATAASLEYVRRLVEFVEKQAGWKYADSETSGSIVGKMRRRTLEAPPEKPINKSLHVCNKYVKIALAYADYGKDGKVIGNGISPAKLMGGALVESGFSDITSILPRVDISSKDTKIAQTDLVYTLPGDVIVYSKIGDPNAAGHIDIRTYHGFVSDFIWPFARNGFPDLRKYKVLGVYRQHSDTNSLARLQAFLRILREHEAKGYPDAYRALRYDPSKGKNSHTIFDDFSKHPSDEYSNKPAGAYQIKHNTFKAVAEVTGWPLTFNPKDQDRVAIYLLQGRRVKGSAPLRTALGYIFEGKVEQAIKDTQLWFEWSCLPSGGRESQITMDELKKKFMKYTEEFCK